MCLKILSPRRRKTLLDLIKPLKKKILESRILQELEEEENARKRLEAESSLVVGLTDENTKKVKKKAPKTRKKKEDTVDRDIVIETPRGFVSFDR